MPRTSNFNSIRFVNAVRAGQYNKKSIKGTAEKKSLIHFERHRYHRKKGHKFGMSIRVLPWLRIIPQLKLNLFVSSIP